MASSKVMASPTSVNSDLAHQNTTCSLTIADLPIDQTKTFGSMSMDDLLKNIYGEIPPPPEDFTPATSVGGNTAKNAENKTVDQVWKEIVAGGGGDLVRTGVGDGFEEMTLEDFLTKAGAVREEDVRASVMQGQGNFGVEAVMNGHFQSPIPSQGVDGAIVPFGNGIEGGVVPAGGAGGRGKRKVVEEPVDKATQQKQRRMIKNRESAARSRERKQVGYLFFYLYLFLIIFSSSFFFFWLVFVFVFFFIISSL